MPTQFCTIHKNVETLRICGRCERPFCPDCLINTPVGGRCRDCARGPRSARLIVQPWRWPLIALTAAVGGLIASGVFGMAGFFFFIVAWFAGQLLASVVLPISGRRAGTALAVVTVVFLLVGVFGSGAVAGVMLSLRDGSHPATMAPAITRGVMHTLFSPWMWVGAAIMSVSAFGRLR